jgi:integral membrane protein
MSDTKVSLLNRLRIVGLLEGVSFLVLLGIAMPLKYLAGMPQMVRVVGWVHGMLFVAFLVVVVQVARQAGWTYDRVAGAISAALLPFGTFVLDRRLRRDVANEQRRNLSSTAT